MSIASVIANGKRPSGKTVYSFEPVSMDIWDHRHGPKPGTLVRKTQLFGPGNVKVGHTYIEDAETGRFYGLALLDSLQKQGA